MGQVLFIVTFLLFFMISVLPATASSLAWKKEQLNEARKNLRVVRNRLHIARIRKSDISHQLGRTHKQIVTLKSDINHLSDAIVASQEAIKRLKKDISAIRKKHAAKQDALQARLRDIYLDDSNSVIDVLAGSSSFSDFINHSNYLSLICESDENLIKTLRLEEEAIKFKQRQINDKYKRMLSYRGILRQKERSLYSIECRRKELLAEASKQLKYYQLRKWELEEHTYELEQEVQQMIRDYQQRNSTYYGGSGVARSTGIFRWPADGYITSPYGWRIHPIYGTGRMHTGIDIGVGYGAPIKAADGGTVIYSGWCGGYGNTVIIDHGRGITTLYGHNSSLYVSEGQSVAKGQVISAAGSTGNSTGPHLHFEVRQDGNPVDPMGYL